MARYNIDIVGIELVIERVVVLGDVLPYSISFEEPTVELVLDRIKFYEAGIYKTSLGLTDINLINSVAPTDLQDAYDKILALTISLGGGGGYTPPYKVYTALLSQSSVNAPASNVLNNDTGKVIPDFTYAFAGQYDIDLSVLSAEITAGKVSVDVGTPSFQGGSTTEIGAYRIVKTGYSYRLITFLVGGSPTRRDAMLENVTFEIKVYN